MGLEETVSIISLTFGGFVLVFGLCSLAIKEKLYMSEALVALIFGIIFGPICLDLFNVNDWEYKDAFTGQISRIVIAIQVMAAGISLPKTYLYTHFQSMMIFLGPVMIWMWCVSALCVKYIFPDLSFLESLIIASCFTPTDPILANSIVQGHFAEKHVPDNVRHIISAESGANDGLGYPFLFLALYLCQYPMTIALQRWTLSIMLYNIGVSIILGALAGYLARKLLQRAEERKIIDQESFLAFAIAFTFFLMGSVAMLGCDDLLACFIAGCAFTWDDWFKEEMKDTHIMEVVDMLLNLSIFVYIGATIPWSTFIDASTGMSLLKLVTLAVMVLLFRRMPVVILLYPYIPAINNFRQAAFTGWFGPIGVGALFYYTVAIEAISSSFSDQIGGAVDRKIIDMIEPIIYFMVLSSVVIHGVTIPVFHLGSIASRTLSKTRSRASSNDGQDQLLPSSVKQVSATIYGALPIINSASTEDTHHAL